MLCDQMGVPTILINNAAISRPSGFLEQDTQDVSSTFAVNTVSHFLLTRLFLKSLLVSNPHRVKGGHVVTISSVLAHLGAANLSAYTASKAALLAYHASLAAELARNQPRIKTILVASGQLDTDLFKEVEVRGVLQRFTGPVIGPHELALKIVRLLDQGMGGEIRAPFYAARIAWLSVLPAAVRIFLRNWSSVDYVVFSSSTGLASNPEATSKHIRPVTSANDADESSSLEDNSDDAY